MLLLLGTGARAASVVFGSAARTIEGGKRMWMGRSLWLWLCRRPPLSLSLSLSLSLMVVVVGMVAGRRLGPRLRCLKGYLRASRSRKMPLSQSRSVVAFVVTARLRGHYPCGGAETTDGWMRER